MTTITVNELIECLRRFPQSCPVWIGFKFGCPDIPELVVDVSELNVEGLTHMNALCEDSDLPATLQQPHDSF